MTVNNVKTAVIALQEGYGHYTYSADITVSTESPSFMTPTTNGNIANGIVTVADGDNKTVARFRSSDEQNLSVDYLTADAEQRMELQGGITTFCKSAREFVGKADITVNVAENDKEQ